MGHPLLLQIEIGETGLLLLLLLGAAAGIVYGDWLGLRAGHWDGPHQRVDKLVVNDVGKIILGRIVVVLVVGIGHLVMTHVALLAGH